MNEASGPFGIDPEPRLYLCPDCGGVYQDEAAHAAAWGLDIGPDPDPCQRCGGRGLVPESDMDTAEIQAIQDAERADDEARNRVDFGP